jgi:hypothetical protein
MKAAPQTKRQPKVDPVEAMRDISTRTEWKIYKANENEKTPIERAMDKFIKREQTDPVDLFVAWSVQPSVIAERLRRLGYDVAASKIDDILRGGIQSKLDLSMMQIAMMELLNDINKTLYKTNRL